MKRSRVRTDLKEATQDYLVTCCQNVFDALADDTVPIPDGFSKAKYEEEVTKQLDRICKLFNMVTLQG